MQEPTVPSEVHAGARFYDRKKRDLGWAVSVSKRAPRVGNLTILDVTTTETSLADSLAALDNERLLVQGNSPSDPTYRFAWASGYANGRSIRIQGMLE
jgi:hypothetical protein